jgi:hypothetical protein
MRQLVILLSFSLILAACSKKGKIPRDILSKQQMEDVLWDVLRGGEFLEIYMFPKDSTIDKAFKAQEWYDEIFRLHKTDRLSFQKSYTWYQQHPVIMKEVLDSLSSKPPPNFRPPGQITSDSLATIKTDSSHIKTDSAQKSNDSLTKPLFLPGMKKIKPRLDSLRKAKQKILPE